MSKHKRLESITYADACEQMELLLQRETRAAILDAVSGADGGAGASARLCRAMRAHCFPTAHEPISLRRIVDSLDARSRREGLYVLHPWDVAAQSHPRQIAPVLLAEYCERLGQPADRVRPMLALLLDHYLLAILSLLAVRAWDTGDPNHNLDTITRLIDELQGPHGSCHAFVQDAETLLVLAVSYYHPDEDCYRRLLDRVRALDQAHQLAVAVPVSALLGAHLRWGLRFMYQRDIGRMRADNVVDYPWLVFGLLTCLREYVQRGATAEGRTGPIIDAFLNGISADPWAFQGSLSGGLRHVVSEHHELSELLGRYRGELLQALTLCAPSPHMYSPLGFACNFPLNTLVASVACTLTDQTAYPSLNVLFTRADHEHSSGERYARRLMQYAIADRSRLEVTGAPLILYDPYDGGRHYNLVMRMLDPVHVTAG